MSKKKALLSGAQVKVGNMSGFDKSRFNAFTAPLGAIVPMAKQLLIPGDFKLRIALSAQLPPLASDAFLRSHLKVEAFLTPIRQLYGGWESFFCERELLVHDPNTPSTVTSQIAALPRLRFSHSVGNTPVQATLDTLFGPHSLLDYLDVKYPLDSTGKIDQVAMFDSVGNETYLNAFFPLCYQWIYDHYYRNKNIEKPLFGPPDFSSTALYNTATHLPYISYSQIKDVLYALDYSLTANGANDPSAYLGNGNLLSLRYRNYGYDYFTTALNSPESGSAVTIDTTGGNFTIKALREGNRLQKFRELNKVASPDYVQTNEARYGRSPSGVVAQKPIYLGSADFPMFTSGVEQTAQGLGGATTQNPLAGIGARYGRAHAEGTDFVCEGSVDEPSILMVMVSLVPEANYAEGVSKDMMVFTQSGSLMNLPCPLLEGMGYEPILQDEISPSMKTAQRNTYFGWQPIFTWHKAGQVNGVHGLFRNNASLNAFIPQRHFVGVQGITTNFLKVKPTDLDNVMAVSGSLSQYGVMVDSKIDLFVVEPLSESVMPSLVDPAEEHGKSVYVRKGASLD